jgi:hypothetical protein
MQRAHIFNIVVDDVCQSWHTSHYGSHVSIGACGPLHKTMQGHPMTGQWWAAHFDQKCIIPLHLVPVFTEPTMYRRAYDDVCGPTLAIHQVDDVMVSAADAVDRKAVLEGITTHHMELQFFAMQECVRQGLMWIFKIYDTSHPLDALLKPL